MASGKRGMNAGAVIMGGLLVICAGSAVLMASGESIAADFGSNWWKLAIGLSLVACGIVTCILAERARNAKFKAIQFDAETLEYIKVKNKQEILALVLGISCSILAVVFHVDRFHGDGVLLAVFLDDWEIVMLVVMFTAIFSFLGLFIAHFFKILTKDEYHTRTPAGKHERRELAARLARERAETRDQPRDTGFIILSSTAFVLAGIALVLILVMAVGFENSVDGWWGLYVAAFVFTILGSILGLLLVVFIYPSKGGQRGAHVNKNKKVLVAFVIVVAVTLVPAFTLVSSVLSQVPSLRDGWIVKEPEVRPATTSVQVFNFSIPRSETVYTTIVGTSWNNCSNVAEITFTVSVYVNDVYQGTWNRTAADVRACSTSGDGTGAGSHASARLRLVSRNMAAGSVFSLHVNATVGDSNYDARVTVEAYNDNYAWRLQQEVENINFFLILGAVFSCMFLFAYVLGVLGNKNAMHETTTRGAPATVQWHHAFPASRTHGGELQERDLPAPGDPVPGAPAIPVEQPPSTVLGKVHGSPVRDVDVRKAIEFSSLAPATIKKMGFQVGDEAIDLHDRGFFSEALHKYEHAIDCLTFVNDPSLLEAEKEELVLALEEFGARLDALKRIVLEPVKGAGESGAAGEEPDIDGKASLEAQVRRVAWNKLVFIVAALGTSWGLLAAYIGIVEIPGIPHPTLFLLSIVAFWFGIVACFLVIHVVYPEHPYPGHATSRASKRSVRWIKIAVVASLVVFSGGLVGVNFVRASTRNSEFLVDGLVHDATAGPVQQCIFTVPRDSTDAIQLRLLGVARADCSVIASLEFNYSVAVNGVHVESGARKQLDKGICHGEGARPSVVLTSQGLSLGALAKGDTVNITLWFAPSPSNQEESVTVDAYYVNAKTNMYFTWLLGRDTMMLLMGHVIVLLVLFLVYEVIVRSRYVDKVKAMVRAEKNELAWDGRGEIDHYLGL